MKKVEDPELHIDIWSLGLIYDINKNNEKIDISMTFTSPMCPFGPQIVSDIQSNLKEIGYENTNINLVFEPMWEPTEELRDMLGV